MRHDLELTELLLRIGADYKTLGYLDRENLRGKLFEALSRIHDNTRKAMWRLNDLKEQDEKDSKAAAARATSTSA